MSSSELPAYTTQQPGFTQVAERTFEDIYWSYEGDHGVEPARRFGTGKAYKIKVDPMPCYGHDVTQVRELLQECHERAPLCAPVSVSVLQLLDHRGVNGWAQQQWEYYNCFTPEDCQCDVFVTDDDGNKVKKRSRNWDGIIVLSGRTTEIHPAIARYVVPHEYGHVLANALGSIRYTFDQQPDCQLIREWAKVRRIAPEQFDIPYGVKSHHLVPSEIFANDFRHALGFETDWWPHGEIVKPLGTKGTQRASAWWETALAELRSCYDAVKHIA